MVVGGVLGVAGVGAACVYRGDVLVGVVVAACCIPAPLLVLAALATLLG